MATLEEITEGLRQRFGEDSGLDATLKFDFGDDGVIFVDATSVPNTVTNTDGEADCTLRISRENFLKMVSGEMDGTTAFMMGKLKIEGAMGVAMKLQGVLRR